MIVLICGASHTGKTALAQRLLERYGYPYLSMDHLKMGLIRSGHTALTPESDDADLTAYLWPIVREMIKTALENKQNMTVEGCYIPFDWEKDFSEEEKKEIRYFCLVLSQKYIRERFSQIKEFENVIETRGESGFTMEEALVENDRFLALAQKHGQNFVLVDGEYRVEIDLNEEKRN